MLDPVCMVNLNARIYDPVIARLTSADGTTPDAYNLQSYNRYSYVDNGPLSATDPTGMTPIGLPGLGGGRAYGGGWDSFYASAISAAIESGFTSNSTQSDASAGSGQSPSGNTEKSGQPATTGAPSTTGSFQNDGAPISGPQQGTSEGEYAGPNGSIIATDSAGHSSLVFDASSALGGEVADAQANHIELKFDPTTGSVYADMGGGSVESISGDATAPSVSATLGGNTSDTNGIPSLSFDTLDKVKGYNGGYNWSGYWKLSSGAPHGGYIVQKVAFGGNYPHPKTYWEAWPVSQGDTGPNLGGPDDTYQLVPQAPGSSGTITINGSARYYDSLSLPGTFAAPGESGHVPESGGIRSTTIDPNLPLQNASNPVNRTVVDHWP